MFYYTKMVLNNYLEFNEKVMLFDNNDFRHRQGGSLTTPFAVHSSGRSHPKHGRVVTDHSVTKTQLLFSTRFDSHKFILLIKRYSQFFYYTKSLYDQQFYK